MNLTPKSRLAIAGTGAALLLSVAGVCRAVAQTPVPAAPPAPPGSPATIPDDAQSFSSSSATWSIMTMQDGRTVKIESKNGALTAEVDGQAVPADRITRTGDTVTIKDEKGNVIAEQNVPSADTSTHVFTYGSAAPGRAWATAPRARARGFAFSGPNNNILHVQPDAPKVMIGVQLIDPDSSLRGHLGLKDDEATMVSAVYEGLPASQAGLEPYDIITGVNGKSPAPPAAVRQALRDTEAGKTVTLDIIHRGQKKTVSITPEKFDAEKLEKAKVDQIAAAANAPSAIAGFSPDKDNGPFGQVWKFNTNAPQPMVATIPGQPGKPITLWSNPGFGADPDEMAKQMQDLMAQMQKQAEEMQKQAERMHEQMLQGGGNAMPGNMDERMKRIEDYMRKMMERENNKNSKDESRS